VFMLQLSEYLSVICETTYRLMLRRTVFHISAGRFLYTVDIVNQRSADCSRDPTSGSHSLNNVMVCWLHEDVCSVVYQIL
jgi:hypothetical protein